MINDQNNGMKIDRKLAVQILKYCHEHCEFYFPFLVMCKKYSSEDDDLVEICCNEWESIEQDKSYQTFELWDNLKRYNNKSIKLLSIGFINEIIGNSILKDLEILVKNYKSYLRKDINNINGLEEFGLNQFIQGKADAYVDCVIIIKKYINNLN